MKLIRKLLSSFLNSTKQTGEPFFTKDVFEGKKYVIGEYTYGKPEVLFENEEANLFIGKFCSIAENVTIFLGGNHKVDWISTYPFNVLKNYFPEGSGIKGHPATKGDVIIENDVWIGRNVTIMSGVKIGNGAVLATGSIITKDVGDYEIWGGNPARLMRKRFDEETIGFLQKTKWWEWDTNKIKNNIHILCSDRYDSLHSL